MQCGKAITALIYHIHHKWQTRNREKTQNQKNTKYWILYMKSWCHIINNDFHFSHCSFQQYCYADALTQPQISYWIYLRTSICIAYKVWIQRLWCTAKYWPKAISCHFHTLQYLNWWSCHSLTDMFLLILSQNPSLKHSTNEILQLVIFDRVPQLKLNSNAMLYQQRLIGCEIQYSFWILSNKG